ncbi:MAG: ATP-binding cassette domain-containing protein, partial [Pirellulaceae bacterium]|nr:ATP-binding cassette domain-containing protein [Pirellulaceae bacterium]
QLKFSSNVNISVSTRLFSGYLEQPYSFYLKRNSAELQSCVQTDSVYVQSAIIQPILQVIQKLISILLLLVAIVLANPIIAMVGLAVCGTMYGTVFFLVRRELANLGRAIGPANKSRFKSIHEAFGSPKLTKLMQLEDFFSARFTEGTSTVNNAQAKQQMLAQLPRFALEGMAFGGIMILAIVLIASSNNFHEVIPLLGFYAFAGYRMMPAVQLVYSAIARLQFGWSRLNSIYDEFQAISLPDHENEHPDQQFAKKLGSPSQSPIIEFKNIEFKYENASTLTIADLSLSIPENSTIGICGSTGAGKTTFLDLLLGLLKPDEGTILVRGMPINDSNRGTWQNEIGYVPQEIVLVDDSIKNNIAFGVAKEEIDLDRVKRAASMAGIADFIESSLPEKYESSVGERGTRLSGGQRQRLGIARALYQQPSLLVFDEATSSLDTETEKTVMAAINDLSHQLTIVMVAHRINTLAPCDTIVRLENGKVAQQGSFSEIFENESIG